ncbi:DUF6271 family protein [Streptomyces sp. BE20]|uniref:DUF6271 family protein n=1 Tax=Streptomyces sp. BE20 TaxID=3002525 RepID=UPI002E78AB80|nr:DUF6271 family protein [Streptomyces sp. BE20]MEE1825469.1 DUF6271 family protein [Streptomyces sp. BE20]
MRRTCSALPTSRARPATIAAMGKEAAYAAGNPGAEVRSPVPAPSGDAAFTDRARTVGELLPAPNVYEQIPLPSATGSVGSNHVVPRAAPDATPTGVAHDRPIVNRPAPKCRS